MDAPRVSITAEEALALITKGEPINNRVIGDIIDFGEELHFKSPVLLENCEVESIKAGGVQFNNAVKFDNCHLKHCDFAFCYFLGGLEIISCVIDSYLDFQCGGHNKRPSTFRIAHTVFNGFVNFFDCMYEGPVIITYNKFEKGTNLLGNQNQPYVAYLGEVVTIQENQGELSIDGEGGDEEVIDPTISPINPN